MALECQQVLSVIQSGAFPQPVQPGVAKFLLVLGVAARAGSRHGRWLERRAPAQALPFST